jgi:hypothetical protein
MIIALIIAIFAILILSTAVYILRKDNTELNEKINDYENYIKYD